MRKKICYLFCLLASQLSAHDDWSLNNHWNVTADFVYLKRNELHRKDVVYNSKKAVDLVCHPCEDFSVLDTKKVMQDFDFEPGYRLTLSYTSNQRSTIEATFMTTDHWEGEKTVIGSQSLSFPFNNSNYTKDFNMADKAMAEYKSQFYNGELNFWRHFTPRRGDYFSVSGIFGLRYLQLDEKFALTFTKGTDVSSYDIHTWNYMGGAQIGLNLQVIPMRWFAWEITGKVGEFLNHSKQHTFLGDDNNTLTLRKFRKLHFEGTFFADVEALITFQWTANVNFHAGYKVIYLNGVALAPNQIDKGTSHDSGKRVNDGGIIYIHGIVAGINLGF